MKHSAYCKSTTKPELERLLVIQSMPELPFLIPSTCNRLNANFEFEGKNVEGKSNFVTNLKGHLSEHLSGPQVEGRLREFTEQS